MNKKKILLLGAGPAGMACAMELSKKNITVEIVEKDKAIGGLAKTLEFKEGKYIFRTDIGPHRFFSKNQYLYDFIEKLLHEKWITVNRQTRQFINGKFYDYPIKPLQAFRNIGVINSSLMAVSYVNAIIKYKILKKPLNNFEDYIVANFGKRLGKFNMLNYTEKIWGIPSKKIHPDWATQRIKGLNLVSTLKNAFFKKKGPKSLIDVFYYPQYGTGLIYETIAKKITEKGSIIKVNSFPEKVLWNKNKITSIIINEEGKKVTKKPQTIVSSVPITEFISLMDPKPPLKVLKAIENLSWRAQVYLFITLDKERITKDNWIYFPNKNIPFGRIAEMKNFSKDMSPKGKTSLFVEFFVTENDSLWNMSEKEIFDLAMKQFEKMRFFSQSDVRKYYVFKKKHVYPVYDIEYPKTLKVVKDFLDSFDNLIYVGRPGRFQYTNQDHSLEMGIIAARSILDGVRYDLDKIGKENEYFEEGTVKTSR